MIRTFGVVCRVPLRPVLFALLCLVAQAGMAQRWKLSVAVVDSSITPKKIYRLTKWRDTHTDSASCVRELENLLASLHALGRLEARIDTVTRPAERRLEARLYVGKMYTLAGLGRGNIPLEAMRKMGHRSGSVERTPLSPRAMERTVRQVLRLYGNRGFPFATVNLDSTVMQGDSLFAVLNLDKGPEYRVDSIIIKGTAKVRVGYLHAYLGIRRNEPFNEDKVRGIGKRLRELPFLTETQATQVEFRDGKAKIYVFADKKRSSQFDGILGVLPNNADPGNVLITGELKLKLMNAFRRGEMLDLHWRKLQAETQDLKVTLNYPYILNTPFGFDGKFNLYKRDTLFLNLQGVVGAIYALSATEQIRVFADIRATNVLARSLLLSGGTGLGQNNADTRTYLYGFGYRMSRLDNRLNPRKGIFIDADAAAGTKEVLIDALLPPERYVGISPKSFQLNAQLDASGFIPIPRRSTIRLGLKGGYMYSPNLFEGELFRIGGLRTLRGFDEESIFASMYGIATLEYRFLLDKGSHLFAFFDQAYYETRTVNRSVVDRPFGFGLGISFETKIGTFSLTYALGKQFSNPIDFRTGKIHVGVATFF